MAKCTYCGQSAGLISASHPECKQAREKADTAIPELCLTVLQAGRPAAEVAASIRELATAGHLTDAELHFMVIENWEQAVREALAHGVSAEEETRLLELPRALGVQREELDSGGVFRMLAAAHFEREILAGNPPHPDAFEARFPLPLAPGENLMWCFGPVRYLYMRRLRRMVSSALEGLGDAVPETGLGSLHEVFKRDAETRELEAVLGVSDRAVTVVGGKWTVRMPWERVIGINLVDTTVDIHLAGDGEGPHKFAVSDAPFAYRVLRGLWSRSGR
ncbi:MAG: hypothetical protein OEY97_03385 [Nitrospirota bacterium]|nr:hypothetical protein [Nitrospirota bacterium]